MTLLQARNLVIGYGTRRIAGPLDADIQAGQLVCLLGPNGAGKSTLLRTLVGLQRPLEGTVAIEDGERAADGPRHRQQAEVAGHGERAEPEHRWLDITRASPPQLAKKISLVLTDSVRNTQMTVYALIALGRYPYSNWLGLLSDADRALIAAAIEATGVGELTTRKVSSLSDGECQKVMLARALAQDTPLLILDEPTAHLDLPSRIQLMQLLHRLAGQTGKGILVSTHELDLALQVADEVWLLQKNTGQLRKGAPEDLVLSGTFQTAFEKEGILFDTATGAFRIQREEGAQVVLINEGADASVFLWTQKALQRKGISVSTRGPVIRLPEAIRPTWVLEGEPFYSIAALLAALNQAK